MFLCISFSKGDGEGRPMRETMIIRCLALNRARLSRPRRCAAGGGR